MANGCTEYPATVPTSSMPTQPRTHCFINENIYVHRQPRYSIPVCVLQVFEIPPVDGA